MRNAVILEYLIIFLVILVGIVFISGYVELGYISIFHGKYY